MRATLMTRCIGTFLVAFVTIAAGIDCASCQEQGASIWGGAGLGFSGNSRNLADEQDFGYNLFVSYHRGPLLFGARLTQSSSLAILGGDEELYSDVALLIGAARLSRFYALTVEAGPAVAWGSETREYEIPGVPCYWFCPTFDTTTDIGPEIGLALQSQLLLKPFRAVGIGYYAFMDVNATNSFWGINLCVVVGRFPF